ncbi:MAG: DUF4129 domain-containing protein [Microbacterium sp.]
MILTPLADVFVPDGDDARRQAEEELAKSIYQAAKPTLFDRIARAIQDFFANLLDPELAGGVAPVATIIVVGVIVAALVVALLVWGRPRSPRSVRRRSDLLGAPDDRTAAQLRADAERAARDGDWDEAVIVRFRALARALLERDLIAPAPGATAQAISREAAAVFTTEADPLHTAASLFDRVRYLRLGAEESDYRTIAATDERIAAMQPASPGTAQHAAPEAVPA